MNNFQKLGRPSTYDTNAPNLITRYHATVVSQIITEFRIDIIRTQNGL